MFLARVCPDRQCLTDIVFSTRLSRQTVSDRQSFLARVCPDSLSENVASVCEYVRVIVCVFRAYITQDIHT